jgi:hypothetical protein
VKNIEVIQGGNIKERMKGKTEKYKYKKGKWIRKVSEEVKK